jgi:hypothetical protein
METLIFALIASYAYRQQEPVVAEPEEFQPFDLPSTEKLRGKQTELVVEPDLFYYGLNRDWLPSFSPSGTYVTSPYVDAHRQPPDRSRRSRRYRRFHLEPLRGGEPGPHLILLRGK